MVEAHGGTVRSTRLEAESAASKFGARLGSVLEHLGIPAAAIAGEAGCDSSTLDRIVGGQTRPLLGTVYKVVAAVARRDRGLGGELVRELIALANPDGTPSADYTGDGKEDADDLVPCAAAIDRAASDLLLLVVDALANDGAVDDREKLRGIATLGELRNHAHRLEHLLGILNDAWSRRRSRHNGHGA